MMGTYVVNGGGEERQFLQRTMVDNKHHVDTNFSITIEMEATSSPTPTTDELQTALMKGAVTSNTTGTKIPSVAYIGSPEVVHEYVNEEEKEDEDVNEDEDSGWEDPDNDVGDNDDAGDDDDNRNKQCVGGRMVGKVVEMMQMAVGAVAAGLQKLTKGYFVKVVFAVLYLAYFITALCYRSSDEGAHRLIGCTVLMSLILSRGYILTAWKWLCIKVMGSEKPSPALSKRLCLLRLVVRWGLYLALAVISIWSLIDEGREKSSNLRSIPGLIIFLLISLFLSTKPSKINWHTIYWSMGLQFLLALFALRWKFGKDAILWLQSRLDEYFANTHAGSTLLFGANYQEHQIIFGSLPVFIFTNATIAILYYLGAMQFFIRNIGNFLQYVLETSPIESTSVAAGIFLEGIASIAALAPYMNTVTRSQLFLIMTSGFASIGGAYMAMLSSIHIPIEHLIAAMVISAPATFAVSKIMMPETQKVVVHEDIDVGEQEKKKYTNILDAMQSGSMVMLGIVGNVAVNAYSLWSFISWINATLTWIGDRVGIEGLTLEEISSYLLYPVSLGMGVESEDCRTVAMLLGYRISSSNLVAFIKMVELKVNRLKFQQYQLTTNFTGPVSHHKNDVILDAWNMTLKDGFISERSEAIATYSLTGFSSFVSAAILLTMLCVILPKRKAWIAKTTCLSLLAGNIANCMTGCFASLFY